MRSLLPPEAVILCIPCVLTCTYTQTSQGGERETRKRNPGEQKKKKGRHGAGAWLFMPIYYVATRFCRREAQKGRIVRRAGLRGRQDTMRVEQTK